MKKKSVYILLFIILIFVWLFWPKSQKNSMPPNNSIGEASKNQSATDSSTRPTLDKLRDIIATDDVAINFYGVVVDSESKPLENVEVEWELIKAGAFAPSLGFPSWGQGTVKTNSKGEFSILNEKGKTISIKSFKFSGYHSLMRDPRAFGYRNAAPHQPDSAKPVRFVMVKDGGKRSEKYDVRLNFDWDGKVKKINIGKKDSLPEIQLIPTRLPVESGNFRYDWKLVIQVEEGGICKGINDGNSVAPESGYVKEVVVQADKNGLWFNNVEALIYFKTEAQEFFELRISAHADRGIDDVTGRISVRRNTEGGRIFE
jgi:hypothetical protein